MEICRVARTLVADDCDLSGSRFTNINFTQTVFEDVCMRQCRIDNANLTNLSITNADFTDARIDGILVTDLLEHWRNRVVE